MFWSPRPLNDGRLFRILRHPATISLSLCANRLRSVPRRPIYICHGTDKPAIVHRPKWCDTPYLHISIRTIDGNKTWYHISRVKLSQDIPRQLSDGQRSSVWYKTEFLPTVNTMRLRRGTGKLMLFVFRMTSEQRGEDAGVIYVKVCDTDTVESRCSVLRPFVITHCKTNVWALCHLFGGTGNTPRG